MPGAQETRGGRAKPTASRRKAHSYGREVTEGEGGERGEEGRERTLDGARREIRLSH